MKNFSVKSYAKVNLGLYITGKRPNGYHELSSIFLPIGLYDDITLYIDDATTGQIQIEPEGNYSNFCPNDETNIMHKAIKKLEQKSGKKDFPSIKIKIIKNIPVGAGLGGGSSNCASILKIVNTALNLGYSLHELKSIGVELGADVPFFLEGKPSLVEGIGEFVTPFELKKDFNLCLLKPSEGVSTIQVYKTLKFDLTMQTVNAKNREKMRRLSHLGLADIGCIKTIANDLEPVSKGILPLIGRAKKIIEELSPIMSIMSGSGSTVFGLFDNKSTAELKTIVPSVFNQNCTEADTFYSCNGEWFFCITKVMRGTG
jgi:4-diphosphocytidyl-2-C-methyl-D-erythritol kinase